MTKARCRAALAGAVLALTTVAACQGTPSAEPAHSRRNAPSSLGRTPSVEHIFIINLENKGYATTFGPGSPAPYLAETLASQGALLTRFYGIAHHSLGNYLAQISGQGPNRSTQSDCGRFTPFVLTRWEAPGQAEGRGCVYPRGVKTISNQLEAEGLTWRGYMEDMGTPCRHPALNGQDTSHAAEVGDQYATRHNPFVYFHAISDASCRRNVVDLDRLPADLSHPGSTPNLSYITPNLCHDGHDSPCVDGEPGGLRSANTWLQEWVPRIESSAAFERDGMLVITFDEADARQPEGSEACCGQDTSQNAELAGITGPGGGRIGAVVLSPFVQPGTRSDTPYNHYSLLRSMESVFGLPSLGYASTVNAFGEDVWTR